LRYLENLGFYTSEKNKKFATQKTPKNNGIYKLAAVGFSLKKCLSLAKLIFIQGVKFCVPKRF